MAVVEPPRWSKLLIGLFAYGALANLALSWMASVGFALLTVWARWRRRLVRGPSQRLLATLGALLALTPYVLLPLANVLLSWILLPWLPRL